ncbi:acyl carrier protein [Schaedlerella arabinosiphila]|uniref:Acyl carrier protein n=1 Tax=Schaedlerella arabinosiphila TaxID=2044587 RepID=A0A9X5C8S6_9FIRM|nr:phosphopantetheine-binding protein [Schaedlerella arabinosiphila]NDO68688.1 acyl carrier protein [Schaedlerella arabinosiphila]
MEAKISELLKEINIEILDYEGDNLYKDGLLDSIQVIDLAVELGETFGIEIPPESVVLENFANKDAIKHFVMRLLDGQNAG